MVSSAGSQGVPKPPQSSGLDAPSGSKESKPAPSSDLNLEDPQQRTQTRLQGQIFTGQGPEGDASIRTASESSEQPDIDSVTSHLKRSANLVKQGGLSPDSFVLLVVSDYRPEVSESMKSSIKNALGEAFDNLEFVRSIDQAFQKYDNANDTSFHKDIYAPAFQSRLQTAPQRVADFIASFSEKKEEYVAALKEEKADLEARLQERKIDKSPEEISKDPVIKRLNQKINSLNSKITLKQSYELAQMEVLNRESMFVDLLCCDKETFDRFWSTLTPCPEVENLRCSFSQYVIDDPSARIMFIEMHTKETMNSLSEGIRDQAIQRQPIKENVECREFNNYGVRVSSEPDSVKLMKEGEGGKDPITFPHPNKPGVMMKRVSSFKSQLSGETVNVHRRNIAVFDESDQKVYAVDRVQDPDTPDVNYFVDVDNHDVVNTSEQGNFLVAADGSGTGPNATEAADRVSKTATAIYEAEGKDVSTPSEDINLMMDAMIRSQAGLSDMKGETSNDPQTTFTCVSIRGNVLTGLAVGDSPCYILRKDKDTNEWMCLPVTGSPREGGAVSEVGGFLRGEIGGDSRPDLTHMQVFARELEEDDIVMVMTDGWTDGFDKRPPSDDDAKEGEMTPQQIAEFLNEKASSEEFDEGDIPQILEEELERRTLNHNLKKLDLTTEKGYGGKADNANMIVYTHKAR